MAEANAPKYTLTRGDDKMASQPILTVRVDVDQAVHDGPTRALQILLGSGIKQEVYARRTEFGLGAHGMSKAGGYRPVIEERDGKRVPVAYELDFKFTPGI